MKGDVLWRWVSFGGRVDIEEKKMVGAEAGIDVVEVDEGADEEAGSGDEERGKGNLKGDDGAAAEDFAMASGGGASFFESGVDLGAGGGPCGKRGEDDSGDEG